MSLFDDAAAPVQFSLDRQIQCAEREVKQRRFVYPNRIAAGRMTQAKADEEIACMEAIAERLRGIKAAGGK